MKLLQLGTWVSKFEEQRMRHAAIAAANALPGSKVGYYRAKIPVSTSLMRPSRAEKIAQDGGPNYITVEYKGAPVVELYGTQLRGAGRVWNELIPDHEYERIVEVLGNYRIYTFTSFKHRNPRIRFMLLGMAFFIVMLSTLLAIPAFKFWITEMEMLSAAGLLSGTGIMFAYAG